MNCPGCPFGVYCCGLADPVFCQWRASRSPGLLNAVEHCASVKKAAAEPPGPPLAQAATPASASATGPSLVRSAGNALAAAGRAAAAAVAGGPVRVDRAEAGRRFDVCRACPSRMYDAAAEKCLHRSCGCFLNPANFVAKTWFATERCPDGHW